MSIAYNITLCLNEKYNISDLFFTTVIFTDLSTDFCIKRRDIYMAVDTSRIMINRIFDLFNGYISTLTVGGGEPSLNIDALEDIYDNMIRSDNVHSVYIVTNGKVYKEKFLKCVF